MQNKFRCLRFLFFAMLICGAATGQKVGVEEAKVAAKLFVKLNSLPFSSTDVASVITGKEKGIETYHVINFSQGGFAVVAANKAAYPILAYSKTGRYPSGKDDALIDSLLKGHSKTIATLSELKIIANNTSKKSWDELASFATGKVLRRGITDQVTSSGQRTSVPPLLPTTRSSSWGNLGTNDDYYIPYGNGTNTCVPVAMAQLMKYYKYPRIGDGSKSYKLSNKQTGRDCTLVGNFSKTIFNYDQMCYRLDSVYLKPDGQWLRTDPIAGVTELNKKEIGKLVYNAGVAVEMRWDGIYPFASGTYISYPNYSSWADSLIKYFRYSKVSDYMDYNTDPEICKTKLRGELMAGRPILFNMSPAGHALILDGYENSNYFHFVNGADGLGDLYYRLYATDDDGIHQIPRTIDFQFYVAFVQPNCAVLPTTINQQNSTLPAGSVQLYQTTGTATFAGVGTFNLSTNSGNLEGAKAVIVAANSIVIKPGFKAASGSTLHLKIEGCGVPISYPQLRVGRRTEQVQDLSISMIDSNGKWTILTEKYTDSQGYPLPTMQSTSYKIKIYPDSIINGVKYGRVTRNNVFDNTRYYLLGYCKEEDGRFYFNTKKESVSNSLLYDFNARARDTIITTSPFALDPNTLIKGIIDSINSETIGNIARRVVYFAPKFCKYKINNSNIFTSWIQINSKTITNYKWVEGIGCLNGDLISSLNPFLKLTGGSEYTTPVICFSYDNKTIYQNLTLRSKNQSYPSCDFKDWVMSVESENVLSAAMLLYPNPTTGTLTIQTSIQITKLVVYQSNGTKIMECKATESLDVSALPAGLYLLEAWDNDGKRVLKKFEKI